MIDVAYCEHDVEICSKTEVRAVDPCRKCSGKSMEIYELEAVARLCCGVFQARHIRAEIEDAVSIGFKSLKIASTVRNTGLRLELMPDLICALIQVHRLSEAVSLLQELEFTSLQDSDKYYALCLDFQLDTGFTVMPYKSCEDFVKGEEENLIVVRDPTAEHRLYTSLWLWCVRNDASEGSKPYAKILKSRYSGSRQETPCSVFTKIKRLEGTLITLVNRIENRNIRAISAICSEVINLLKQLEKETKIVKLLKPRYLLMKAYYRQIRRHDESSFKILDRAKALADKMEDRNTSNWINHSRMVKFWLLESFHANSTNLVVNNIIRK